MGLVNRPNDISLSRANPSQAKFKGAVGGNLLQSWVNLTIVATFLLITLIYLFYNRIYTSVITLDDVGNTNLKAAVNGSFNEKAWEPLC